MMLTEQEASISKAGELETLSEAVSSLVHVDLKGNLLSDWQEVKFFFLFWLCWCLYGGQGGGGGGSGGFVGYGYGGVGSAFVRKDCLLSYCSHVPEIAQQVLLSLLLVAVIAVVSVVTVMMLLLLFCFVLCRLVRCTLRRPACL